MTTVNIIGCGRVGKTIGKLLSINKIANIIGIVNSSYSSAKKSAEFVGEGIPFDSIQNIPVADIYLITTRDDVIESICKELIDQKKINKNSIVIHCSGALSSEVMSIAKSAGGLIASVHPVKSFANPDLAISSFKNTYCAFDGDEECFPFIKKIFEGIGGVIFKINKSNKKQYHAAMVLANNYLITLHFHAMNNLIGAGVEKSIAKQLVSNMMNDAFNNLKNLAHVEALTGPLQRGDIQTITSHLESLKNDSTARNIYSSLGIGTLPITNHSINLKTKLDGMFRETIQNDIKLKSRL